MYLDLNHWIGLSKAYSGHPHGSDHIDVLSRLLELSKAGEIEVPLSDSTYLEISKNGRHPQRLALRQVIEALCGFRTILPRPILASLEVESMLDQHVGPRSQARHVEEMPYVGYGVGHAFGVSATPRVPSSYDDKDGSLGAAASLRFEQKVIEGPIPSEEAEMRASGWDPSRALQVAEDRANDEVEQVERLNEDPKWRGGHLRRVVSAREVLYSINELLHGGLSERRASLSSLASSPEEVERVFDAMPCFDVAVSLKVEYHRNSQHVWSANDIHDIDALCSTIPYCDIVVTDKAARSAAEKCQLPARYETEVISDVQALLRLL